MKCAGSGATRQTKQTVQADLEAVTNIPVSQGGCAARFLQFAIAARHLGARSVSCLLEIQRCVWYPSREFQ